MSAPITGQIAVSGTAQSLGALGVTSAFIVKAPLSNANAVFLGPAGVTLTTGYQLDPGDLFEYERRIQVGTPSLEMTPGDLYVVGTAPDRVTWLASP